MAELDGAVVGTGIAGFDEREDGSITLSDEICQRVDHCGDPASPLCKNQNPIPDPIAGSASGTTDQDIEIGCGCVAAP